MMLSLLCGIVGWQPWTFVGLGVALLVGLLNRGRRPLFVAAIACAMLATGGFTLLRLSLEPGRMTRSFFGIYQLREQDGARMLVHGTTAHGLENLGSPERERMATSYYAPRSGIGEAMRALPALFPNARVGIVGLGAGTLACYSRPDQRWSFYEIDPAVVRIARDPARFRFLARCQPHARIVVGDARLMLDREPGSSADVLVIDAFSSDSVPMHLLTREAFELYRRHLTTGGLLMVHISNRYLDFRPLLAATAAAGGWTARERFYVPSPAEQRDHAGASLWVAMSADPRTIARLEAASEPGSWRPLQDRGMAPWTDDFSTILPLIKWRG
jgi:spermidine synthase